MSHAKNDAARQLYGALFDDVSAILYRHDPIGINFDTNTDEYDPEARTILPRLRHCTSVDEAVVIVHEEFQRWFGAQTAGPASRYQEIAAGSGTFGSSERKAVDHLRSGPCGRCDLGRPNPEPFGTRPLNGGTFKRAMRDLPDILREYRFRIIRAERAGP
jgi:hypothetical protein